MSNPILRRELIGMLRMRRALAMQLVPALALSLVVLLRWPADSQVGLSGQQSQEVFRVFAYGLLGAVLLLVPAFPATTIVREKITGTLALLLNSSMSCWSIYFGKLVSILGVAFLPLAMSLPGAAACYAMGGVSLLGQLVPLYAVLGLATVQYAAVGLLVSSRVGSSDGALRTTYGLVLVLAGFSLLPYPLLQDGAYAPMADLVRCVSPVAPIMEILGHGDLGSQGLVSAGNAVERFEVLSLIISALCIVFGAMRLQQTMLDRPRPQGVITDDRPLGQRWFRRFMFVVDPQRRKPAIGSWTNPVMVKEFRSRPFGRSHWMLRLVAFCAVVSLVLTYAASVGSIGWGVETIGGIMILLQGTLLLVFTPSLAASLISAEHEAGTWTLLQMTPLSAGAIVRGKLASVIWPLLLLLLASVPGYLVMAWIRPVLTQQIGYVLATLALSSVLALTASTAVSSCFRRTAPATVTAYILLVVFYAGPLLIWLGRDAPFGHGLVEIVLTANPLAAAMSILEVPGFSQYQLVPTHWWFVGAATAVCLVVLTVQTWRLTRPK